MTCISIDLVVVYVDQFIVYYFYYFFLLVITFILDIVIIFLGTLITLAIVTTIFNNIDSIIALVIYLSSCRDMSLSLNLAILLFSYYRPMISLGSDNYR